MAADSQGPDTPTPTVEKISSVHTLADRHRRRIKAIHTLVTLVLMALCVGDTCRFLRAMEIKKPTLKRWLPYAAEVGWDDQLYSRHPDYLYPPFFLVLLRPFTHMPAPVVAVIWQLMKYIALLVIFAAAWDLLARAGPLPVWAKVASVIVSLRFIHSDLGHGNVNIFICLCVVLAAWLLARNWRIASGLLIATAACIKVTPALWAVYLLYKRQWRALLGVAVGAVLALEVLPLLLLTPQMNHALLARWHDHVILSFVEEGRISSLGMNQSMAAVTNRLLGRSELAPDEKPVALIHLDDDAVKWIQRAIAAALIVLLAWSCRGKLPASDPMAFATEWAIVAPIALALSGYTWTGHFCLLILANVALLAYLAQRPMHGRDRLVLWLTIAAFSLFLFTTDIITPAGRKWSSSMGLPLMGALFVAASLAVVRERCRRRESAATTLNASGGPIASTIIPSERNSH